MKGIVVGTADMNCFKSAVSRNEIKPGRVRGSTFRVGVGVGVQRVRGGGACCG